MDKESNEAAFLTVLVSLVQKSRPLHSLLPSKRADEIPVV